MEELLRQQGSDSDKSKQVLDQMESLEKILLEKGITQETLQRMQRLEHELLEMENAGYENDKDKTRRSETGIDRKQERLIQKLEEIRGSGSEDELLRRNRILMSPDYQKRVKDYFNDSNNREL
jgi:translation initiation factor 2B subunit (eIF-2B alpha/beta/delta family)